jgi:hypothetical protein
MELKQEKLQILTTLYPLYLLYIEQTLYQTVCDQYNDNWLCE